MNDSSASRIGGLIYWTNGGVYLFSDSSGRSANKKEAQFYNLLPPTGPDYEFLSRGAAIKKVNDQVWNFDHLGECEDIPDFGADAIVAGAGDDITVNDLELEGAGAVGARLFSVHCGGSQSPICLNAPRFIPNALGCQVRCARAKIPVTVVVRYALNAKGVPKSPLKYWLIDSGCGHDLVGLKEVQALQKMFKLAAMPITFVTANGETDANEYVSLHVDVVGDTVDPYILATAPAVLSMGMRCREYGYNFVWLGQNRPAFITPGGTCLVLLEVEYDIPYLNQDGSGAHNIDCVKGSEIDAPLRMAGLCRWHGKIALDIECEVPPGPAAREKALVATSRRSPVDDDEDTLLDLLPPGPGGSASDDPAGSAEVPAAVVDGGDLVVGGDSGAGVGDISDGEPCLDEDDRPRGGMSLSEVAHSDEHKLTHKPFNQYCPVCV